MCASRDHRQPGRAVDHPADPEPPDGPRRPGSGLPVPGSRPGRAVHRVVRRGPSPVFRMITCDGLPVSGELFWPGQRDVQQCQDGALDAGEVVEDQAAGGVCSAEAVEGCQGGAGGGDGGASFGQDAGQGDAGAEGGAQLGFDQPEDEQGDADDGDEGFDPVVVVQEHGPDPQGLLEVAVALLDDPLVLVDFQDVQCGQLGAVVVARQVGGERVEAVEAACRGDRVLAALPADDRLAGPGAGGHGDQVFHLADQDLGDFGVDLFAGLVVAAAEPAGDFREGGLGLV